MLDLDPWVCDSVEKLGQEPDALNYLRSRNILPEQVQRFSIGFVKRFHPLSGASSTAQKWNQTFCSGQYPTTNRLVFPHHDDNDKVISFSTRSLNSKYYSHFIEDYASFKGIFWGWKPALPYIWESKSVIITEGIFDLLSIANIRKNSICSLTRTLSEAQYSRISRYVNKVVLAFDMDEPGRKGCEYWANRFQRDGISTSILEYPYKDLNEWWTADPRNMISTLRL